MEKRPYHILSVQGTPKTGKTHLASSAPGGVAFQSLDFGTEGVIEKFEIPEENVREYNFAYDFTIKSRGDEATEQADRIKTDYWKPFNDDCAAFFADPTIRTVVWDTATEVWEMLRLSNFGKLQQNPQLAYGPVNAEYKALVRMANIARKNMILIHHEVKEYKDVDGKSQETGRMKLAGNSKIEALVHTYVRTLYEQPVKNSKGIITTPGKFKLEILGSRYNPDMNGMIVDSPTFVELMALVAPHVPEEAWLS